jgi:hypothetical protein
MKRLSVIFLSATILSGLPVVFGRGAEQPNEPGITDTEIKIGQIMPYSGRCGYEGVHAWMDKYYSDGDRSDGANI